MNRNKARDLNKYKDPIGQSETEHGLEQEQM